MRIKFDKDPLAVEENNCASKFAQNAYIMCHLDAWSKFLLNHFKSRNCLFGATNVVNYSDKEKWVYSDYAIAFAGANSWRCGNDYAKNIAIYGFDNSSSSHADNRKNVLVLGKGVSYGINGRVLHQRKRFILITVKQRQNFARVYNTVVKIVICLSTEKKYLSLKLKIIMWAFPLNFA